MGARVRSPNSHTRTHQTRLNIEFSRITAWAMAVKNAYRLTSHWTIFVITINSSRDGCKEREFIPFGFFFRSVFSWRGMLSLHQHRVFRMFRSDADRLHCSCARIALANETRYGVCTGGRARRTVAGLRWCLCECVTSSSNVYQTIYGQMRGISRF